MDTDAPVTSGSGDWFGFPNDIIPQVGRIWLWNGSRWLPHCSGTVVTRGLVVTAGHCLVESQNGVPTGRYYSKLAFVPGQTWNAPNSTSTSDIRAPWGSWEAWDWWAPDSYRFANGGPDWGVIQIKPQNGKQIGDVVGSWPIQTGIRFNVGAKVWSTGYPGMGFWDTVSGHLGRGQYACSSTWRGEWSYGNTTSDIVLALNCPMNGGASGGPWLVQLSTGQWVIGGVNNTCYDDNEYDDEPNTYCTPTSSRIQSLEFDGRFIQFWNSVLKLVH